MYGSLTCNKKLGFSAKKRSNQSKVLANRTRELEDKKTLWENYSRILTFSLKRGHKEAWMHAAFNKFQSVNFLFQLQ